MGMTTQTQAEKGARIVGISHTAKLVPLSEGWHHALCHAKRNLENAGSIDKLLKERHLRANGVRLGAKLVPELVPTPCPPPLTPPHRAVGSANPIASVGIRNPTSPDGARLRGLRPRLAPLGRSDTVIYAIDQSGNRIAASPAASARCPGCGEDLRPRCGHIVVSHWAHIAGSDCDPWAEHETAWHVAWKERFPQSSREAIVRRAGGWHRADVRVGHRVIEFQHSSISPGEIAARESFYGSMTWVWDISSSVREGRFHLRPRGEFFSFRWLHARKTIASCRRPCFLDLDGEHMLDLRKFSPAAPSGGWGYLVTVRDWTVRMGGFVSQPSSLGATR